MPSKTIGRATARALVQVGRIAATGLVLSLWAAVSTHAGAVPPTPPPVVPPPGGACTPSNVWISTSHGDRWLTSPSVRCYEPAPGGTGPWSASVGDGPIVSASTPRLVLSPGEEVSLHFESQAQSVVVLQTRASPRTTKGRSFRLSPFSPRWRVRAGSGVLIVTTTEVFQPPPSSGIPGSVEQVRFAAVYRAALR